MKLSESNDFLNNNYDAHADPTPDGDPDDVGLGE